MTSKAFLSMRVGRGVPILRSPVSVDFVVYLAEVVDTGARRPIFDSDLRIHGNAEKAY